MTPEQRRKKVYDLTYAHLLRPDPVNWLVAADLLEEDGQDEAATKWRRRASSLEPLRAAFADMKADGALHCARRTWKDKLAVVDAGPVTVIFSYASRACSSVQISVCKDEGPPSRTTYLGLFWAKRARYVTQKLIEVIDWATEYELHPPADPDPPVQ